LGRRAGLNGFGQRCAFGVQGFSLGDLGIDLHLKFFNEAERLDENALPGWMQTPEMRRAMNTLKAFSEKEHAYYAYQARQDFLREQQSIQLEFEDLRAEVEQARAAEDEARAAQERERVAKEEALAENERLKRLLADKSESSGTGTP
jgi:hypothetical protein